MANIETSIALITKYSTEGFDKVYKADACSSVLAKGSNLVQFTGAKTVKVAKMQYGGLHDYERNNIDPSLGGNEPYGYQGSMAKLTWEERTLRMDRAAKYVIEQFDNEESGDLVIGNALTEINRTVIIPEVDAYCFSEIYANAGKQTNAEIRINPQTGAIDPSGSALAPLAMLNKGFLWLDEHEVPQENQVVFMSPAYLNELRNTRELTKFMQQGDYKKDVSFTMSKYEGRDFIVVPPARFRTAYTFGDGYFKPASGAKYIDFIVMPKDAAVHVVKFQKTRILSGDIATAMANMDGYVLLARIYHDCFVFDNKKVSIYAHWSDGTDLIPEPDNADTYEFTFDSNGVIKDIVQYPGDAFTLYFALPASATYLHPDGTANTTAGSEGDGTITVASITDGSTTCTIKQIKSHLVDVGSIVEKKSDSGTNKYFVYAVRDGKIVKTIKVNA